MTHYSPLVPRMVVGPSSSSSSFITTPSSSSSSSSSQSHYPSMKLRNLLLQTYVLSQVYLNKAKSALLRLFKDLFLPRKWKTTSYNNKKLIFGSFRLYYNWCSTSIPNSLLHSNNTTTTTSHHHYNNFFNTTTTTTTNFELQQDCSSADDLSRYLQWLEDNTTPTPTPAPPPGESNTTTNNRRRRNNNNNYYYYKGGDQQQLEQEKEEVNEIDRLADLFIANCHEKFRLEKQESYRMFQEMMARSV